MRCPQCQLVNPEEKIKCECGYDFKLAKLRQSYIFESYDKASKSIIVLGWIFSLLGGWLGIVISCVILFSRNKYNKQLYKFDEPSRKTCKIMLMVSIVMTILSAAGQIMLVLSNQ